VPAVACSGMAVSSRIVHLRNEDRQVLERWARSPSLRAGFVMRAKIVLLCDAGEGTSSIARRLEVSRPTVISCRQRYIAGGLGGLVDAPRSGRPKTVDDLAIVTSTLEPLPSHLGVTNWSSRLLAKEMGIGDATVARAWRRYGVQPWRGETFKFSTEPALVAKVKDVVGLYLDPPEKGVVLCLDEKGQRQALDRTTEPVFPLRSGLRERATHDYVRHGTTTLFGALEIATGKVTDCCDRHTTHDEFLAFLKKVGRAYPRQQLHVVVDNYATHSHPDVEPWLAKNLRVSLYFTPTSGSWLNLVEVFFSIITRQAIRRDTFRSVPELIAAIRRLIDGWNERCRPFSWVKTGDQIRAGAPKRTLGAGG
jgi:DDE superfamily endonuclease/Winged helix-turn helix